MARISFMLAFLAFSLLAPDSYAAIAGAFLSTPYEQDGPLVINGEYKSGFLEIRISNPSSPDVETNSYIYIPEKFEHGGDLTLPDGTAAFIPNGTNIEVTLGDGFEQTGQPEIYPDWIGDAFERGVDEIMKYVKVVEIAVIVNSANPAKAAVMVSGASGEGQVEKILDVYKTSRDNLRAAAMGHFISIITTLQKPDKQLPIDRGKSHWILPPSSALIIKIPVKQKAGNPSYSVMLKEYRMMDTKINASLGERKQLEKWNINVNAFNSGLGSDLDFPEFPFKSAQIVDKAVPSVITNEFLGNMPQDIGQQIWSFFESIVKTITISLKFGGSDLDMRVIDPEGNIYYGSPAGDNAEAVTINNAMPGEWKIEVINRDVPPGGEPYSLTVAENDDPLDVLDFDILKSLREIRKRNKPFLKDVFGIMEVKVKPKGKDISYLEINDSLNGSRASMIQVFLSNGQKEVQLYKEAAVKSSNGLTQIIIDFSKGIFTDDYGKILKKINDKTRECYKRGTDPRTMKECMQNAKEEALRENTIYKLEGDRHIIVRYYNFINFKNGPITTETKVKGVSTDGSTLIKGKSTNFIP
ncbi:MAG: hypothetical protein HYX24_04680 [Candidatus Aenigmarchaeota archaeon]|nr:hypothetical protein [Candidatus Aenigmarchaeota archaeon]